MPDIEFSGNERKLVLFICTGNLCRSPMAEYLLRRSLGADAGWVVESAGTHAAEGWPASSQAVSVLRKKGIDLSKHRSRLVTGELARSAELIVTMTGAHADEIKSRFPDVRDRVFTLRSFDADSNGGDISDPIGSSMDVYREICGEIEESLLDLILRLKRG